MPCLSEAEENISDVDEEGRSTQATGVVGDGGIALDDEGGKGAQHSELEIEIPVAEDTLREGGRNGGEVVEVVVQKDRRARAGMGSEGERGIMFATSLYSMW